MTQWNRWVRQPQTLWWRKAVFQVHLWTGVGIGLYVAILCATGAVLVFSDELMDGFATPLPAFEPGRAALSSEVLSEIAAGAYPGFDVVRVGERFTRRRPVIEIWLEQGTERHERLFNPYTGEDVGEAVPRGVRAMLWLIELHDELLLGETGRFLNGMGALLLTVLAATGAVVWWPGQARWRRSLSIRRSSGTTRFLWDVHSVLGFWFVFFVAMWGISGFYLAIPGPFGSVVDAVSDPEAFLGERPGDAVLRGLVQLHFGHWNSLVMQVVWAALGLVPVVLFLTGAIVWWRRVVTRGWRREPRAAE